MNITVEKISLITIGILSTAYIGSVLLKSDAAKASVLIADDWVLLRSAAINIDNQLLQIDQSKVDSGLHNKIVQQNSSGAYVIQDGWRLTLHLRPSIKKALNSDTDLVVHLVPFRVNNKVKWSCIHKDSNVTTYTPPYGTSIPQSNIKTSLLPWTCK